MLCDRCGYDGNDCPFPQENHCEYFKEMTSICSCCETETLKSEMQLTYDCHGIPFRYVCPTCYNKLMSKGYDGEYYTEFDENIDYDY